MEYFRWQPLVPSDIILILTVIIAFLSLFQPRVWKWWDNFKQRKAIKKTLKQLLESFERDLKEIRDKRNSGSVKEKDVISFNKTSKSEVSHYYDYYREMVVPNLYIFNVKNLYSTIRFFDHYKKNFAKVAEVGTLEKKTVDNLLNDLKEAFKELK